MFMRFVQMSVAADKAPGLRNAYRDEVIPVLRRTPNCLFAALIAGDKQDDEVLSMTIWRNQSDAEAYERSGAFRELVERLLPLYADSAEWKVQLSKDLTLEYRPVVEDPVVTSFTMAERGDSNGFAGVEPQRRYLRLVSATLQPERIDEFKLIYSEKVLPALRAVKGCRYACLIESAASPADIMSMTLWDDQQDADEYERSGLFGDLVDLVKHTFTGLTQWKMALDNDPRRQVATSEDLKVKHYTVVAGQNFISA